eukprot:1255853-Pyramimonas_sp.AAC.1
MAGQTKSQDNVVNRDLKRAIIEDRKLCRGVCCACPSYADHRLGCPMRRPSRTPEVRRTPWLGLMVMVGVTVLILTLRHILSS